MSDFIFNVKGLTAQDRAQWEKDNINELNKLGYTNWDDTRKDRYFRNSSFKNKFGSRADYNDLKTMAPEKRDSIYLSSPDSDIENIQEYQNTKQVYEDKYNSSRADDGTIIGSTKSQWNDFDKLLDEVSPYYKRYKGTEYFPLDNDKKVELMSIFQTESEVFGKETAAKKMASRIKDEVSENQPLADKLWNGLAGMGANIAGGIITFAGNVVGGASALFGVDRLTGENQKENYFSNLLAQTIDNPWTRYGNQVMQQGTFFTEDDPEKSYNVNEVIRTTAEEENLIDNIFSINTIPELMQQSGFTVASMMEGYGLTAIGNRIFNTLKYAIMGSKLAATTETMNTLNKTLQGLNTAQRRYNAYVVPALVGQGEGALNALNTKIDYLEDAKKTIDEEHNKKVQEEAQRRFQDWLGKSGLTGNIEGAYSEEAQAAYASIYQQVAKEFQPMYDDAVRRSEENADKAAMTRFGIESFINGAANVTLKATMFNGKVNEALKRSKVGKLFAGDNYSLDDAGNVVAKNITKGRMAWNMSKEMLGEGLEEYGQDLADAFSRGAAENDLANYMVQRYNGVADDAIVDSWADNLGAAFASVGKKSISKDAIQSGIYGALGQATGTFNVNALLDKSTYTKEGWKDKNFIQKVNNIWRMPFIESYYNDKQENQDRKESSKALNEWLSQGNNRERLTTLRGSLGWAESMQKSSDEGDEFSYRNSRLGKQIQDYFMLEQLKGTSLYDSYIQRYMDILNAQEGDEMSKQIAQYDNRPLDDIKKDAQSMLDIMQKVQVATADLEKSLGNSIPQETKEALIYGKLSMEDWRERATQLENEILSSYEGSLRSSLTDEQKSYIARHGAFKIPNDFRSNIENLKGKISNLEKNKDILSDAQKKELNAYKKQLKTLQDKSNKAFDEYDRIVGDLDSHSTPVLTEADIMSLNPVDRYKILNPKNRNKYSKEQQAVIDNLINTGTAKTSDFMNKVEDAARISDAQTTFLSQYNEALRNPEILSNIERSLRLTKKIEDTQKSYKKLGEIQNYSTFVEAVDNALLEADDFEATVLRQTLKDNPLYQRYKKDDDVMDGIFNQLIKNDALKDMSMQDKALVAAMTKFLSRRGVDISNYDEAVSALTSADDSGKSNLITWIEAINQKLPEGNKISLDNIGYVVDAYKKALEGYKKNEEVKEEITRKPEEKSVVTAKPAPVLNIFSSPDAVSTLEESGKQLAAEKEAEGPIEKPLPVKPSEVDNTTLLSDDFINNNEGEILDAAEKIVNAIRNASPIYDDETKNTAIDVLNSLGSTHFNSIEELYDAVSNEGTRLLGNATQGGDINERTGSLLQQVGRTIKPDSKKTETATSPTDVPQQKYISLAKIRNDSNGFLSRKFKEWGVDDYIRSGKLSRKSGNMTTVYYVALDDVTNGVKEDMKGEYTDEQFLPVLAIVRDDNGPLVIGKNRYQPIGVLPNSEKDSRASQIRQLALNQPNKIIATGNRKVTSSVIVSSPPINISSSAEGDKDFLTLMNEGFSPEERAVLEDNTQSPLVKNAIIEKYINKIARRLFAKKDKSNKPTLYYRMPTMKGDESETEIAVLTKTLEESTSPKNGRSLMDILSSRNSLDIVNFNSRTRNFIRVLSNLIEKNDLTGITSDGTEFTGDDNVLSKIEGIGNLLKKYIYPTSEDYSIRPAKVNGKLGLDLYLGEERLGRVVDSIADKEVNAENMADILFNLFISNGTFRQYLNWQVDKSESFYTPNTKHYDKEEVENLIRDNILRLGIDKLDREIGGVELSSPVALREPVPVNPATTVVNTDNSTSASSQDTGTASTQSGKRVDTETGLTQQGKEVKNEVTTAMEEAQKICDRIEADSKEMELSEDGLGYVNKRTGKRYARVTSIKQADEQAGERFDPDSPWATPSTNIGTGVDEFIRDFFAGEFHEDGKLISDYLYDYPNATQAQWKKLVNQLQKLKNYLDAQGLTIIPRDVTVTGTIKVTDNNGRIQEIPVAGTLDLLAYDREGNFHIFDMKTYRTTISEEKASGYSRQLTMYKQFLEGKYGVKVKSLNIIPIHVEYPAPNSHNKYSVFEGNQLMLNDKEYRQANPVLGEVGQIPESPISIQYSKLSETEKALIESSIEGKVKSTEAKPEPLVRDDNLVVGKIDIKRRPIVKKDGAKPIKVESNPMGTRFESLTPEQQEALRLKYSDMIDVEDFFNSWTEEEKKHELGCL